MDTGPRVCCTEARSEHVKAHLKILLMIVKIRTTVSRKKFEMEENVCLKKVFTAVCMKQTT